MRRIQVLGLATLLAGCSILNDPEKGDLTMAVDGGPMDAPMDAPLGDAPMDAPPLDAPDDGGVDGGEDGGMDAGPESEDGLCQNGIDDDGDGLTDCADFECQSEPACCDDGTTEIDEDWTSGDVTLDWNLAPTDMPAVPMVGMDGARMAITRFDSGSIPRALVRNGCLPLAVGTRITVQLKPVGEPSCEGMEGRCVDYAAFALAAPTNMLPGNRLTDEISVIMNGDGELEVTQDDRALLTADIEPFTINNYYEFTFEVTPGLEGNTPVLFVTLKVAALEGFLPEGIPEGGVLLDAYRFVDLDLLLTESGGCEGIPGLHAAIEGRGDGVYVGDVVATTQRCVNPSQFIRPITENQVLTSDILGFSDSWTEGAMTQPTLASTSQGGGVLWTVFADGTNDDPSLERILHVGYGFGHSRTTNWDAAWSGSGAPKLGDDPPSCAGAGSSCDDRVSVRDPNVYARTNAMGELATLIGTYAREVGTPAERDAFGIHVQSPVDRIPTNPIAAVGAPVLRPTDVEIVPGTTCASLRDPAIVPASPDTLTDGWWLFFTCLSNPILPFGSLYAAKLESDFALDTDVGVAEILGPGDLGQYAADGVRGPEPVVVFGTGDRTGEALLRIWFVSRSNRLGTSISMAQAETDDLPGAIPTLVPFEANPVLTPEDPVLGSCADECPLQGLAVTRRSDDLQTLRFLIGRRVTDGGDRRFELVPLEQFWKAF